MAVWLPGLWLGIALSWAPFPAATATAAGELLFFRTVFQAQRERPTVDLTPGEAVEVREQFWRVRGASRLRVESSDPDALVVMRFRTADERSGALVLTVTLVSRRGKYDFRYEGGSEKMEGGIIAPLKNFRVGDGIVTELAGAPGEVAEIRIQDDATAELRLLLEEGQLVLRAIPADEGGELSGRAYPIFRGQTLNFLDYTVLGAGGTDNGYGEVVLFEHFALKVNGFLDGDESAVAARLVVRQQVWRSRDFALWLEGGGGFFTQDPSDPNEEKEGEATVAFGATGIYRTGDWGVSVHAASFNGPTLAMVMAGWQFSESFSLLLEWQSLLGFSGFGAGLAISF